MQQYNSQEIEPKWQKFWDDQQVFKVEENKDKNKFFGLIEFPYPSGDGLHTGHLRSNTAMDIICRKRRMQGYNVLYPIGFDAFGLPTENYAIKKKIKPQEATVKNIATFTKQLKEAGFSFDWSRSFSTTDEDYYRWTQWIFIQMFKNGLAEKKKETINWCTSCKIGLANEEVVNGACERCGGEVVKKIKEQWVLKITKYADRLIEDLDLVDYLERIKTQQINWIGKSVGAEIRFKIYDLRFKNEPIDELAVFTTRPDTLFGATFMVVAPEHELVSKFQDTISNFQEIQTYIEEAKKKSDLERTDLNKEKTGVEIKGIKAINPVNNKEIPIFVADYVMMGYGTGAIMAVPAHDERDFEFAKKYNLPIRQVIKPMNQNCIIVHGSNDTETDAKEGEPENMRHWKPWLKENLESYGIKVSNELYPNDWMPDYEDWKKVFEKNEINENTILIGHSAGTAFILRWLAENKKKVDKVILVAPSVIKAGKYESESNLKNFTLDFSLKNHFNSLVVFYSDNDDEYIINSAKKVHEILGGELLEFRKGHFVFGDMGTEEFPELLNVILEMNSAFTEVDLGEMVNSEFLNGLKPNEAIVKMTNWLEEKNIGKKQMQYKLHDWIFSRQRYWGEPIPMVYCEKCGWQTVPENELPVVLPEIDDYLPTDEGDSPLAKAEKWLKTKCPVCGGEARRETDVMPNWAGSNWYFIRYTDPKNNQMMVDPDKTKYWLPVDWYNGGMEHTTLHLLYSRFVWKFLYDIGAVPKECGVEPYAKRTAHGMILGEGGVKMSKSKGNVINPDEYVKKYGADTLRVYEMFMGPFDQPIAWEDKSVNGVYRFLNRVWNLQDKINDKELDSRLRGNDKRGLDTLIHQTIKKVGEDIEEMKFNTAVAALMILLNELEKQPEISIIHYTLYILLLSPFAPHLAEELWQKLGHQDSIQKEKWPKYDPNLIQADEFELVVQVNGRVRERILVPAEIEEAEVKELVIKNETVLKWLNGQEPKKVIYVKGKLVSIVV